ncbi:hypothetical protein Q4F19_14460 [Sphingomonas sp. BIUV-7]|uniref:Circumsporozoite protein n=1 Tax=Sphingomonas natans TaxID=3063330 RepID=A0ABT8YD32_9SPHN|nr:hypothetical protein [Sphingomonas sp. BIUV-7]MDO6415589.1 hypothetical protein [Sphingomonas sp. BIUV-7]
MKKAISILSLTLAAAGLSACSKSAEQNVTTENLSNSVDVGATDNLGEIAPNASDASGIENVSNATS